MTEFRGYIYDSISPHMPIIAVIFDAIDDPIQTKVVANSEEGSRFIIEALASLRGVTLPLADEGRSLPSGDL